MLTKRFIAVVMLGALWCGNALSAYGALEAMQMRAQSANQNSSASAHEHPCCPGLHALFTPALFVAATVPVIPCGEHPCCAKRAPESPATVPATSRADRPDAEGMVAAVADSGIQSRRDRARKSSNQDLLIPSYFERSTVLRI